jgi:hypothetical protein
MPAPMAGEPGLFRLGDPILLERVFRAAGLSHIGIHAVTLHRRFASAEKAVQNAE